MTAWDRAKFLVLFAAVWFLLVSASMVDNPLLPFVDAMRLQVRAATWVLVLFGLEVVRQLHLLISEHWSAYHRFWTNTVSGGSARFARRWLSDWTRFRLARAVTWSIMVALAVVVVAAFLDLPPVLAIFELPALLWAALPVIVQLVFVVFVVVIQVAAIVWLLARGGIDTYYPGDIETRFADVWGQDHVVAQIKEDIARLQAIEAHSGFVHRGLLLWGPPGTGKTLIAEAMAGETGKPYVVVEPGAFTTMVPGVGVLKVKSLFRKLRKLALRFGGVIVLFDDADSLGGRVVPAAQLGLPRGTSPVPASSCNGFSYLSPPSQWIVRDAQTGGPATGAPPALLTELSRLSKARPAQNRYVRRMLGLGSKPRPEYRILVMMATNRPEALDDALLRAGRIDRSYQVGYPSKAGRLRTYEGYLNQVRHRLTAEQLERLAVITPCATGATSKDLVNEALSTAMRDRRAVITWSDVISSQQLRNLGPPEDVAYFERERHAAALHEACHAVIAYRVRRELAIDLATIETGSGMVSSIRPADQLTRWRSDYEADIHVALASLAGERMFFDGDSSAGVCGDLESATSVASMMEGRWGMGSTVSAQAGSQHLADRIEDNLATLLEKTARMLREYRRDVLVVAHALELHKTLAGEDVAALIEGRAGPGIDGMAYRDPGFLRELEAYHNAAALAHRAHGRIGVALPSPPETGPSYQWQPPVRESVAQLPVSGNGGPPRG